MFDKKLRNQLAAIDSKMHRNRQVAKASDGQTRLVVRSAFLIICNQCGDTWCFGIV